MFESSTITEEWDGRSNGKECKEGVYFYILHYVGTNGKEHENNGTITLTRIRNR